MNNYLFILLLVLVIVIVIFGFKKSENFGGLKLEYIKTGSDSFDDKLFNDVKMYKSDTKDTQKAGIFECLEKCKGTCVEYGMTGNAFCFPK